MHGNFNELVDTLVTEESEMSQRKEKQESSGGDSEKQVVKFELDISVPSFEIELMKLKLIPGLNQVARPAVFEKWVTYVMIGMSMWLE